MFDPMFSVIIPAGDDAMLETTVMSLQSQWFGAWEAIIVVHGPAQTSLMPALRLAALYPRLRVLSEPTAGPSAARNLGAGKARSKLLAFLDAGDAWLPGTLGSWYTLFSGPAQLAVLYGRVAYCDAALLPTGRMSPCPSVAVSPTVLLGGNPLGCASSLAVRGAVFAAVGGFDEALDRAAEQDWLFRAHRAAVGRIQGINALVALHRARQADPARRLVEQDQAWQAMMARASREALPDTVVRRAKALHLKALAVEALSHPETCGAAVPLLRRAVAADPTLVWRQPTTLAVLCAAAVVRVLPGRRLCASLAGLVNG